MDKEIKTSGVTCLWLQKQTDNRMYDMILSVSWTERS